MKLISKNTIQTKSLPISANFATYKGGGYVLTLGRTMKSSIAMLENLKVWFSIKYQLVISFT